MAVDLKRNWTEFTQRWFGEQRRLELAREVQPVVLVDDVRHLNLPPMRVRRHIGAMANTATVGQLATMLLYNEPDVLAQRHSIATVLYVECARFVQAAGLIYFGSYAQPVLARPTLTGTDIANPVRFETNPEPAYSDVGVCEIGTTAVALNVGDECGVFQSGVEYTPLRLGIWVWPGCYFWVQHDTANTVLNATYLQWSEYRVNMDQFPSQLPKIL